MAEAADDVGARATQLITEGQHDEAIRICRRGLLTHPDVPALRLTLGRALMAAQRFEQARVEMLALARREPDDAEVHRMLGESYLRSGQRAKGEASLQRAVDLDPEDQEARALLEEAQGGANPASSETIERWFAEEDSRTVEHVLPEFADETVRRPPPLAMYGGPTVQIDPSFAVTTTATAASRTAPPSAGGDVGMEQDREPATSILIAAPSGAAQRTLRELPRLDADGRPAPVDGRGVPTRPAHLERAGLDDDDFEVSLEDDEETDSPAVPTRAAAARPPPPHDGSPRAESAPRPGVSMPPGRVVTPVHPSVPLRPVPSAPPPAAAPPRGSMAPRAPSWVASQASAPPPSMTPPSVAPPPAISLGSAARPQLMPPRAPGSNSISASATTTVAAPLSLVSAAPARSASRPFLGGTARVAPEQNDTSETVAPSPAPAQAPRASSTADPRGAVRPWTRWGQSRRGVAMLLAALLGGTFLIGVVVRRWLRAGSEEAVALADQAAADDGRRASLLHVLEMLGPANLDEPARLALRARALATLTVEHGEDHGAEVETLLSTLPPEEAATADARLARALWMLAQGRGGDALLVLEGLALPGGPGAEVHHVRSLCLLQSGRLLPAEESARQALTLRPATPRFASFEAVLRDQAGDPAGALAVLDAVPNGAVAADVRLARARVLFRGGVDTVRALADAEATLAELEPTMTRAERGWAMLMRARGALGRGDTAAARSAVREAQAWVPVADEAYALTAAEVLLALGEAEAARGLLSPLSRTPVDVPRRALVSAAAALDVNDVAGAEAAILGAGVGAPADLLRGRIREARGELEPARQLYEHAAVDPRVALEARTRTGAVLLRLHREREARVSLEHALRIAPSDVQAVTLFVRAALATGDAGRADAVLSAAAVQRPGEPAFMAARGMVWLALGRVDEALAVLEQATGARPTDAELRASLGDAALRAGRLSQAAAAFAEAVRLAPTLARARLGVVQVALEEARFDDARRALAEVNAEGAGALDVARASAELAVASGQGHAGAERTVALLQNYPGDPALLASLGDLWSQAESDGEARDAFTGALRADDESPEALLGRATLETRRGDLGGAARSIDGADRAGQTRGRSASFRARIAVARARLRFEVSGFDDAQRLALEAISLDPHCADAHLMLATIASERGGDPTAELRLAVTGNRAAPEALGRLAVRLGAGSEACALAGRYVEAAPRGYDREDVDRVLRGCR